MKGNLKEILKGNLKRKFKGNLNKKFKKEILKGKLKEKFEGNLIWGTMAIVAGGTTRAGPGEPGGAGHKAPPLDIE